jgi:hypothetical protein
MEENTSRNGGISFTGALTITFIVLKLCKVISWSWVWVLSPLWIGLCLGIVMLIVYGIILLIKR